MKRAEHYRAIAALMRQRALSHREARAREQALSLAADYERLAEALEPQPKSSELSPLRH
jgi:hypothetical protein